MSTGTDFKTLPTLTAQDTAYILGKKADGSVGWVNADNLHIYRGQLPFGNYTDIDDPNLPGGLYTISGTVTGTFPPGVSSQLGAAKLEVWRAVGSNRIQILHLFWKNASYIRRKATGGWNPWREYETSLTTEL